MNRVALKGRSTQERSSFSLALSPFLPWPPGRLDVRLGGRWLRKDTKGSGGGFGGGDGTLAVLARARRQGRCQAATAGEGVRHRAPTTCHTPLIFARWRAQSGVRVRTLAFTRWNDADAAEVPCVMCEGTFLFEQEICWFFTEPE